MAINYVTVIDDTVLIQNVIVSVFDKEGLDEFIPGLLDINPVIRFYSTGGTYDHIKKTLGKRAAEHLVAIADYTGQPEMQGGLVKTLDFKIYLGLLSEAYNQAHCRDLERAGAVTFDMIVSNLYPFSDTIAASDATPEAARANIDIGGPCLIRAGAKNYHRVAVVTDKKDYPHLLNVLKHSQGLLDIETRFTLARKAFLTTAQYDTAIADYLIDTGTEAIKRCYTIKKPGA